MAVWIYALLLGISRNPITLVLLRSALFMTLTIGYCGSGRQLVLRYCNSDAKDGWLAVDEYPENK